jgi:subtilase family serine protease
VNAAVHDAQRSPAVISISWGKSEDLWTAAARQAMDQAFQAAGLLGITVCCASGDNGSGDNIADGRAHADFPSSSPNALGCGGTSLNSNGTAITAEVAWNNGPGQISGGGISDVFAVPGYQNSANLPPSANQGARPGRGVPDVAGHAASYAILFFGRNISAYGTSAVAPLWAGLTALLNQTLGTRAGFLQPVLYQNPAALRDITSGNNTAYTARPGWDACTGLGSPNGTSLVAVMEPAPARRGSRNFIQSNWGTQGNFELLVPHGNVIKQYFRNNDDPALAWHFLRDFGYPAPPGQLGPTPRSVTFIQSNFRGDGVHGNFETIVRVAPAIATQPDHLDFWWLDSKDQQVEWPLRPYR